MDLYRYFHPHHHPRLRNVPLRHQEIQELLQAALEIKRAISRARIRSEENKILGIDPISFERMLLPLDDVIDQLSIMSDMHPGDDVETIRQLTIEREAVPGWEMWSQLVKKRIDGVVLDIVRYEDQLGIEKLDSEIKKEEKLDIERLEAGQSERYDEERYSEKRYDRRRNEKRAKVGNT